MNSQEIRRHDPETLRAPILGMFAWFGIKVPFQDRMKMIKDAGFDATCVWWEHFNESKRRLRHLMPEAVRDAGLILHNAHVPYRGCDALWSADGALRMEAVERHIAWVEDCAWHKIPTMVMHVSIGNDTPPPSTHGLDSFRRILDCAEDLGVVIALENTRGRVHMDAVLERFDSPFLGLCYDSAHDWLWGGTPLDILSAWGHRLAATHLSDTDGARDQHWLPGQGIVDFAQIAQALDGQARDMLMLEVVAPNTPRDAHAHAESFLSDAFAAAKRIADAMPARTA